MIKKILQRTQTVFTAVIRFFSTCVTVFDRWTVAWEAKHKRWSKLQTPGVGFATSITFTSNPWVRANYHQLFCGYDNEEKFKAMVSVVWDNTMVSYDGMMTVLRLAQFCEENEIEGDYAEVGCWRGGCSGLMALANDKYGKNRRTIHVFDSFEGMPHPQHEDFDDNLINTAKISQDDVTGELKPIGWLADASPEDVSGLVVDLIGYPKEKLKIHVGWFQDTVPEAAKSIGKISILRLDGDFYDSYKVPLEHLYDKVVPGGFIIIDDWIYKGCREAVTEFMQARGIKQMLCHADVTTRYFQKI